MTFQFAGQLDASKSIMNRLLILQSFASQFSIVGDSQCEDVSLMRNALQLFAKGENKFACGLAGTVLRFLALRVSRQKGSYELIAKPRLLERPQEGLLKILWQLGVETELRRDRLLLRSYGWRPQGDGIHVTARDSSQFASALILSAVDLEQPLFVLLPAQMVSRAFFDMTKNIVRSCGLELEPWGKDIRIKAGQKLRGQTFAAEVDMASCFALAAAGILAGHASITNFVWPSLQPDAKFIDIFEKMGAKFSIKQSTLLVSRTEKLRGLDVDLNEAPDLLPVAAIVASFADGVSMFRNVAHAAFKESNRLHKTCEILRASGAECQVTSDGLKIQGSPERQPRCFYFSADQDHRLAMAAGLLMLRGFGIDLAGSDSVAKSFPQFWQILAPALPRELACKL